MKNKQAIQMMIDCGNTDIAILMMQKEIGAKCESLIRKGDYDFGIYFPKIVSAAMESRKHIFTARLDGDPIDCECGYGKMIPVIIE